MKKTLWLALVLLVASVSTSFAAGRWSKGQWLGSLPRDSSNNMYMYISNDSYIRGSASDSEAITIEGNVLFDNGVMNVREVFNDVPAPSTSTVQTGIAISTATLRAATSTWTTFSQPAIPTNLWVSATFDAAGSSAVIAGSCLVTGINARGEAATETFNVLVTTTAGNVAFATITSAVWTITSISSTSAGESCYLNIGQGDKIGLSNDIQASGDIISVIFDDSGTTTRDTTYTLDTTYDTIKQTTVGDGTTDVLTVTYKVKKR